MAVQPFFVYHSRLFERVVGRLVCYHAAALYMRRDKLRCLLHVPAEQKVNDLLMVTGAYMVVLRVQAALMDEVKLKQDNVADHVERLVMNAAYKLEVELLVQLKLRIG